MVGYSQGSCVVRIALDRLKWEEKWDGNVVALVLYGDPGQRVKEWVRLGGRRRELREGLRKKLLESYARGIQRAMRGRGIALILNCMERIIRGTKWHEKADSFLVAAFTGSERPRFEGAPQ